MPTQAVLEPVEVLQPVAEPVAAKPDVAEVAEFIARQVLDKDAEFFDG